MLTSHVLVSPVTSAFKLRRSSGFTDASLSCHHATSQYSPACSPPRSLLPDHCKREKSPDIMVYWLHFMPWHSPGYPHPELPVVFLRFSFPATLSWLRFLSLIKSHVLVKMFAYWVCFWVHPSYWPLGLLTWSSINLRWRRDTGFFSLSSAR